MEEIFSFAFFIENELYVSALDKILDKINFRIRHYDRTKNICGGNFKFLSKIQILYADALIAGRLETFCLNLGHKREFMSQQVGGSPKKSRL